MVDAQFIRPVISTGDSDDPFESLDEKTKQPKSFRSKKLVPYPDSQEKPGFDSNNTFPPGISSIIGDPRRKSISVVHKESLLSSLPADQSQTPNPLLGLFTDRLSSVQHQSIFVMPHQLNTTLRR